MKAKWADYIIQHFPPKADGDMMPGGNPPPEPVPRDFEKREPPPPDSGYQDYGDGDDDDC